MGGPPRPLMSRRRESFRSDDGRSFTLWRDIHDVVDVLAPMHGPFGPDQRTRRRELGCLWRGQTNAGWDLTPTLYRPPTGDAVQRERRRYTGRFMDALSAASHTLGLSDLTEKKLLAIAQHYGFPTTLLDFTFNPEVAAYFATKGRRGSSCGVCFSYTVKEYEDLRNPFAALGFSQEYAEEVLAELGTGALPPLWNLDFSDVPRMHAQEGVFVECTTRESAKTLLEQCIDRFYFTQQPGLVYVGGIADREWMLAPRRMFKSDRAYEDFLELARDEKPELFRLSDEFGEPDLFPPADPISQFAEEWRKAHPDPTTGSF